MYPFLRRCVNHYQGVCIEGQYELVDGVYYLRQWRLATKSTGFGIWYKIHGNQKKDIGVLELQRSTAPTVDVLPDWAVRRN